MFTTLSTVFLFLDKSHRLFILSQVKFSLSENFRFLMFIDQNISFNLFVNVVLYSSHHKQLATSVNIITVIYWNAEDFLNCIEILSQFLAAVKILLKAVENHGCFPFFFSIGKQYLLESFKSFLSLCSVTK